MMQEEEAPPIGGNGPSLSLTLKVYPHGIKDHCSSLNPMGINLYAPLPLRA